MRSLLTLLIICGAFAVSVLYLGRQPAMDAPVTAQENPDLVEQAHQTLNLASHTARQIVLQPDLTQTARDTLGLAREVLDKLAQNNKDRDDGIIQGKVEKGDTIAGLLEEAGGRHCQEMVNAASRVFQLKNFKAGHPYAIMTDPATGDVERFEYEIDDHRRLVVENSAPPRARIEDIEYTVLLEKADGIIDDSLFQAVADMGEHPQLALKLVDLFGSEINFIKDLQEGDKFSVLVEKRFRDGEYRGYGRILAARFTNKGKTWEAWLFRDAEGNLNYYNSRGENLKKTFLMAPLAITRLTSSFSHNRKHPILGVSRPHLGVDYGAPTGTPVKAVGNGEVTQRQRNGGYGNQIIIRHGSGLESMYAHLAGFARGLQVGQKVRQGQVIGYVGSTGLATGPHLDFRLRQDGNFINPVKAINPRGAPVDPALMAAFRRAQATEKSYLDGHALPAAYTLDSIVPLPRQIAASVDASVKKASAKAARRRGFMSRGIPSRELKYMAARRKYAREKAVAGRKAHRAAKINRKEQNRQLARSSAKKTKRG